MELQSKDTVNSSVSGLCLGTVADDVAVGGRWNQHALATKDDVFLIAKVLDAFGAGGSSGTCDTPDLRYIGLSNVFENDLGLADSFLLCGVVIGCGSGCKSVATQTRMQNCKQN